MANLIWTNNIMSQVRRFSSFVLEYQGNIFIPNWVHVPAWNICGVERSYQDALKSFQSTCNRFPTDSIHIGEICTVAGKGSLHAITKFASDLRTHSNRDIVVHPTLLPTANWNEWFKLALSSEYYGKITNLFLAASPGTLWKQLYPDNSLHYIYANHSFLPLSKIRVADDNIWPTFSEDPEIKKEMRETAVKDLDSMLSLRHAELKHGGIFCFDTLLKGNVPEESAWKQLNQIVTEMVQSGRIKREERQKIAMRNYERDDDIIDSVLERHEKNFKVILKDNQAKSRFPAWNEYEKHKDPVRLGKEYAAWLKEWSAGPIMMNLGENRSPEEKKGIITDIYDELEARCTRFPIPLDVKACDVILEKI